MRYLTADEILLIHSMVVDTTGGAHGVRDMSIVTGIAESPKQTFSGKDLYESVFAKAAVYAREIITQHPFIDGNKRTGMTAAAVFLEDNGCVVNAEKGELVEFALRIVAEKCEIAEITEWFEAHTKKRA